MKNIKKENNELNGIIYFNELLVSLEKRFENLIVIHHLTISEHKNGVNLKDLDIINQALTSINKDYISDINIYNSDLKVDDYFFDEIHLNSYGAIELSNLIEKKIKQAELICNKTE